MSKWSSINDQINYLPMSARISRAHILYIFRLFPIPLEVKLGLVGELVDMNKK